MKKRLSAIGLVRLIRERTRPYGDRLDNRTDAEVTLHNVDGLLRELEEKMGKKKRSTKRTMASIDMAWKTER